jgi:hypothetical protein
VTNIVVFDNSDTAHVITENVYVEFEKALGLALGNLSEKSRR